MPQALNKVKRRIATVESTRKITNAMKLISSVKLRQAQSNFLVRSEFYDELEHTVSIISNYANAHIDSPYLKENKRATKTLYVVVSSSLGLCGSYNYNITRYLSNIIKNEDEVVCIGEKIFKEMLKNPTIKTYNEFKDILNNLNMSNTRILSHFLLDKYNTGEYRKIVLVYTKFINQIATKVQEYSLLPIAYKKDKELELRGPDLGNELDWTLDKLVKKYLVSTLYIKFYECIVSEQSSRRNAMDNADKNAEEIADKLKIEYNKARQSSITQEITEVVSGSINK